MAERAKFVFLISSREMLSTEITLAWHNQGIELVGPVSPESMHKITEISGSPAGCLIDLTEEADVVVEIINRLEIASYPFLFVVKEGERTGRFDPFEMTAVPDDIRYLFHALVQQGSEGVLH